MTGQSEWYLIDSDFATRIAPLAATSSHLSYLLNEPGSGQVTIPLDSNAASQVTSGMFAAGHYRGAYRSGFVIDNIDRNYTDASEEGGKAMSLAGRGALAILEDGVIWSDGSSDSTRTFASQSRAVIMLTLIAEAQARGALANLTCSFDTVLDSVGESWSDSETYSFNVGATVLEVLKKLARTGIDFDLTMSSGVFVLNAYKLGIGSDKSDTVFFRTGVNCEEVKSEERGSEIANALLVKYKGGFITVADADSMLEHRRRERMIDLSAAQTSSTATTLGAAELELSKSPKKNISLKIYDGIGPRVFEDYALGDYIMLDVEGVMTRYRVLGIQLDFNGVAYSNVVVDLNSIFNDADIGMAQDIEDILDQLTTVNDAGLLEVSYWAAIGEPVVELVTGLHIIGNKLYFIGTGPSFYSYDIGTGEWIDTPIDIGNNPLCITSVGTDLYIGCFHAVYKYDTITRTLTNIGDVHFSESFVERITAIGAIGTVVYVAGTFETIDGVSADSMAQYDTVGDVWSAWGSGKTGQIDKILTSGADLWVAGSVTNIDGTPVSNVGHWDGMTWDDMGGGLDYTALALALYGTNILAGGGFTGRIAEWDGASWTVFGGGLSGVVTDIAVYLTDVYAVGNFTAEGNYITKYSGGGWWQLRDGVNDVINKIALYNDDVYVAGAFTQADGKDAPRVAVYFTNFESLLDYLDNSGSFNMGAAIHNAPAAALTNASEIPFWDAVTTKLRKITWLNMWLTIKALTDTIYVPLAQTANRILVSNGSGGVTTDAALKFDATTKQLQIGTPNSTSGDYAIIQGNDGASVFHIMEVYGSGATISPFINGIRGEGTAASPTALSADKYMLRLRGSAYDGPGSYGGTSAEVRLVTSENHTPSAHGARIELYTTPAGSITLTKTLVVGQGGIASNVTAGKMLTLTATDNFTLTVPATGTAALLATANVFTANQRINATLGINAAPPTLYNLYSSRTADASNNSSISAIMAVTNSAYSNSSGASFQTTVSHASGSLSSSYALQGTLIAGMTGTGTLNVGAAIFGTIRQASANAITQFIGSRVNLAQDASSGTITTATNYLVTFSQGAGSTITNWEGYGFETMSKNGTIVNAYAIRVPDITFGSTTNNAIKTGKGLVVHSDQVSIAGWQDVNQLRVTSHTTQTLPVVLFQDITAATNAVRNVLQLEVQSTGTAANGLGVGLLFAVETATAGTIQNAGRVYSYAIDNTSATRKYATVITAFDYNAERIGVAVEADGSAVKLGFFGHVAAAQPSAYSLSNVSIDRSYDANATTVDELADVLGTLIADLQSMGLVG